MAANLRVSLNEFSEAVSKILDEYGDDVINASKETVKPVMTEGVKRLKASAPKKTGKYKKSWKQKTEDGRFGASGIIYASSPGYRLAHLLEHGHALVKGGRRLGRVAAKEHIAPVNEWVQDEYEKRLLMKLKG